MSLAGESDRLCPGEPDLGNTTYLYYDEIFNPNGSTTGSYSIGQYESVSVQIRTPELSQHLVAKFQSGLDSQQQTLTGSFDIAFRQFTVSSTNYTVDNSSYIESSFSNSVSYLLENDIKFVEGLIVDLKNGGIGFRNHSVPKSLQNGAEWEEEILWWTPEMQCVPTNISNFFTTGGNAVLSSGLVDRGGFVDLQKENPDTSIGDFSVIDAQATPRIFERARYAAWAANAIAMVQLNLTDPNTNRTYVNSSIGKTFRVNSEISRINPSMSIPSWVGPNAWPGLDGYMVTSFGVDPLNSTSRTIVSNPYNITRFNYSDVHAYYEQVDDTYSIDVNRIDMKIAMVSGPAYSIDGSPISEIGPDQTYERPIYICAAATKAHIKKIRLRYNITQDNALEGLHLVDIKDKTTSPNDPDRPLWGMETPTPNWTLSFLNPLYGMISKSQSSSENTSSISSDYFYIPASSASSSSFGITDSFGDNLPFITGPPRLWYTTFFSNAQTKSADYSGAKDFRIRKLWQDSFRNSTGVELVYKLIWTDLAMNAVTGAKGIHNARYTPPTTSPVKRAGNEEVEAVYPVFFLEHRLRYSWLYAIPAFICLSVVGAAVISALFMLVVGKGTVARLRYYLFSTTSGRVFAAFVYPEDRKYKMDETERWVDVVGHKVIDVSGLSEGVEVVDGVEGKRARYVSVRQDDERDM